MILDFIFALSVWFFLVIMIAAILLGLDKPKESSDLRLLEWHHGYLGIIFFVLGFKVIGILVLLDDVYQHFVQVVTEDLTFQSPLKKLYVRFVGNLV